jgi:anti-anti-sigma regulatory factor
VNAPADGRTTLAINLELGGRHSASARVEWLEAPGDSRVARVALSGWIDRTAERRLERALDALAPRVVSRVVLDCSGVSRLDGRQAERLLAAVARLDGSPGPIEVRGLPPALRERLGARARVRPNAEPLVEVGPARGERAS